MSSSKTITTLGEPTGALISKRGGALALRASSSVLVGYCGSRIGSTVRSSASVDCPRAEAEVRPARTKVRTILVFMLVFDCGAIREMGRITDFRFRRLQTAGSLV